MKIGFVTFDNPDDKNAWSGVIHKTYASISKEFEVKWIPVYLDYPSSKNPIVLNLWMIIYKIFRVIFGFLTGRTLPSTRRTNFYAKAAGKSITATLRNEKSITILFFLQNNGCVAYLDTNLPIVILQDATFASMYNYYQSSHYPDYFYKKTFDLDKRSLTKATHLVFASEWAKQSAINNYQIDSSKISVIELGACIDMELKSKFIKVKKKLNKESLKLFFLGGDWYRKGGDIAVKTNTILNKMYGIRSTLRLAGCKPPNEYKEIANVEYYGFLSKNNPFQYRKML